MKSIPSIHHYLSEKYETLDRFKSYWYQIHYTKKLTPKKVLEIGIGNGFYKNYLKNILNTHIETLDIEKTLNPDYVGDIADPYILTKFLNKKYDLVVAFEVLEHMPYEKALIALKNMLNISNKWVLFSVPDSRYTFKISIKIPGLNEKTFMLKKFNKIRHIKSRHHYWEIGWKNYPLSKIENDFKKIGKVIHSITPKEAYFHRFFIMKRWENE